MASFDSMMSQFMDELAETFPEYKRAPVTQGVFMNGMNSKWAELLGTKSESFMGSKNKLVKKMNLQEVWATATPASKNAIWDYLQALLVFASQPAADSSPLDLISKMFTPETLKMIETAAESCAAKMQEQGIQPQLNEETMQALMSEMMKSGGLGAMLGK